ncbi:MAG: class I SAM-dependent methyltransferase [Candidatus Anammoxibacter sp.]
MAKTIVEKDSFINCHNSQGLEFRAVLLKLGRYTIVFEVYNPYSIVQLSEVLGDCKIYISGQPVYFGRLTITGIVHTGLLLVCEASLEETSWLDVGAFSLLVEKGRLKQEFVEFLKKKESLEEILPEFRLLVGDMQTLFMNLRQWFEQVEFGIRSNPSANRSELERSVIQELHAPISSTINPLFERLEELGNEIKEKDADTQDDFELKHRAYIKRHLHSFVLSSPFFYRTFTKPLGYAGDYEMVNMMFRDPFEGSSLFSKMLNFYVISTDAPQAHRNRIVYLTKSIRQEIKRVYPKRIARIFNLGCGPAQEVQNVLCQDDLCEGAEFTLVDFNEETVCHARSVLNDLKARHYRKTTIQLLQRSVHQILKQVARDEVEFPKNTYDLVYCAGLFDYLSDKICKRLTEVFYTLLAPGGLLIVTNVDPSNPVKRLIEYFMEWHLIYRNAEQLASLKPDNTTANVLADPTGVNIFLEIRKPENCER